MAHHIQMPPFFMGSWSKYYHVLGKHQHTQDPHTNSSISRIQEFAEIIPQKKYLLKIENKVQKQKKKNR